MAGSPGAVEGPGVADGATDADGSGEVDADGSAEADGDSTGGAVEGSALSGAGEALPLATATGLGEAPPSPPPPRRFIARIPPPTRAMTNTATMSRRSLFVMRPS